MPVWRSNPRQPEGRALARGRVRQLRLGSSDLLIAALFMCFRSLTLPGLQHQPLPLAAMGMLLLLPALRGYGGISSACERGMSWEPPLAAAGPCQLSSFLCCWTLQPWCSAKGSFPPGRSWGDARGRPCPSSLCRDG